MKKPSSGEADARAFGKAIAEEVGATKCSRQSRLKQHFKSSKTLIKKE